MGISTSCSAHTNSIQIVSQSLSGWDGDFHLDSKKAAKIAMEKSQSLSGWDGDFHIAKVWQKGAGELVWSQSLSGWDGDFHLDARRIAPETPNCVAIPFRVGWGFPHLFEVLASLCEDPSRNPFQGGMGISTIVILIYGEKLEILSQSLSGWDGDFHRKNCSTCANSYSDLVAIPFRVGWGFPHVWVVAPTGGHSHRRNPFQGGMGISTARAGMGIAGP